MRDRTTPNGYRSVGQKSNHSLLGLMRVVDKGHEGVRRTSIGSLLHSMAITRDEERVIRKTVKKGSLLHDLVDRVFDRRGVFYVGQRVEV